MFCSTYKTKRDQFVWPVAPQTIFLRPLCYVLIRIQVQKVRHVSDCIWVLYRRNRHLMKHITSYHSRLECSTWAYRAVVTLQLQGHFQRGSQRRERKYVSGVVVEDFQQENLHVTGKAKTRTLIRDASCLYQVVVRLADRRSVEAFRWTLQGAGLGGHLFVCDQRWKEMYQGTFIHRELFLMRRDLCMKE